MNLGLDITPRTRGRAAKPVAAVKSRDLDLADLGLLGKERGTQAPALKRLQQRHHTLARLLASGSTHAEAGIIANYSQSRISILMSDPAFKELLTFYSENVDAAFIEMNERIADLSMDALEELRTRMEEDPESFSNSMLLEIMTKTADRSGNGPQTQQTNLNVNINVADRLQAARERVAAYQQGKTIEGKANDDD